MAPLFGISPLKDNLSPFSNWQYVPSQINFKSPSSIFSAIYILVASINPYTLSLKAPFFAFSMTPSIVGVAIKTIIANITITASNSISVNPFLFMIYHSLPTY